MPYTIKKVADLAGLTVRALHHYDHVGLLRPAAQNEAGYRLYAEEDLERLQQILFFRELGFSLRDIKAIVDSPDFDRKEALMAHRKSLREQQERLAKLVASVERTIEALERGTSMDEKEMFDGFDRAKMEEYREEARARWGAERVDESYRRVAKLSKVEWEAVEAETEAINKNLAALMDCDPADPAVQQWIGRWFQLIDERYYDCTPETFRGLGELYVSDSRFTAFYERYRPGLAEFVRAAMAIYADEMERME
ncbi:MAG: MerR family transcriptional regulator [Chloroflexi bacterium]|nr:MerR family transcriptional regulator [Chloroflexota bacterium]